MERINTFFEQESKIWTNALKILMRIGPLRNSVPVDFGKMEIPCEFWWNVPRPVHVYHPRLLPKQRCQLVYHLVFEFFGPNCLDSGF